MFQPKNRYYMVIFPKLSTDTLVPLYQPKSRYHMVIFPKLSSDTPVPLLQPISRYCMVIYPKLSSDTLVPLFQPKVGIKWSFSQNYHQLPILWLHIAMWGKCPEGEGEAEGRKAATWPVAQAIATGKNALSFRWFISKSSIWQRGDERANASLQFPT